MSRLIETMRFEDGQLVNPYYHERRMRTSASQLFGVDLKVNVEDLVKAAHPPQRGVFKFRLIYDSKIISSELQPYVRKPVERLKVVHDDEISYGHKWEDRTSLDKLFARREGAHDILIVRNGWVTDASFANLAFLKGSIWVTPKTCLLNGTMRQFLLEKKIIQEADIREEDILRYEKVKLINSMLAFDGPEVDVSHSVN